MGASRQKTVLKTVSVCHSIIAKDNDTLLSFRLVRNPSLLQKDSGQAGMTE